MHYTLQVSNHPGAGSRIPTAEAGASWETVYDGPIASAEEMRETVEKLSKWYRHARAFRGKMIGKLDYAVLRTDRCGHHGCDLRAGAYPRAY